MNAETAEKEKNQTEETKEEVKASEAPVEKKDENKDEEKAKSVDKNSAAVSNLRLLENIEVKLTVEVGNTEVKIKDLLRLNEGSVVELDRLAGDALDILANADVLASEDTRTLKKLLEIHGIQLKKRSLISYHDHNASKVRPKLLAHLDQGKSIAYASEAGTPLIADPGFSLLTEVLSLENNVTSAPGPCALIAALTLAGLPTDKFYFE